ncbi:ABC transporter ATP-binding protein [Bdellovibrio sp. 22V]|uniref:ABC transporter ATP-binding protein n=1 Tax=Bdellovibrio TaxID=958 RepID=UPI0025428613|nr:ABC transporter ATP-binding protein [Bdellovibrio sp. 22V]WII70934.1 ABC transporter ATP-binding protein [Bdellovibrio sp. 22V]
MKVVDVQELSVKFGDYYAVNNITFSVEQGSIFGFLGANGAGKTTTIRVLCGLLVPTHGKTWVCGLDVQKDSFEVKRRVGYMSQKFTLYDDMSVRENLGFASSLRKLDERKFKEQKNKLLEFIRFRGNENSLVRDLPGGVKQQVSLVAAVLHDPELIFLDEPTAGVSPAYRQRFWALIKELAGEGKTVFVTTHYMDEAEMCEQIALMRSGELIALDSPRGLKQASFPDKDPHDVSLEDVFIHQVEGT